MTSNAALSAIALVLCAVLVAAGIRHHGGLSRNLRSAAIWVALIAGLAVLLTMWGA